MARDAQNQAKQTYQSAKGVTNTSQGNADSAYSSLFPLYQAEATHPQGFDPADLTAMNTAGQQSTGGALAGVAGEANLRAARDRNEGGFAPALDDSAMKAADINSNNALGIQTKNAQLKEMNRQAGLSGMENLWHGDTNELLSSLGLQNTSTDALTKAGQSGWFQNMTGLISAVGEAAKGAGAMGIGLPKGSGG